MLIRPRLIIGAEVWDHGLADVLIEGGKIAAIAAPGSINRDSPYLSASGGAILPGLHDHHVHLAGLAAKASSVWCGPPEITDEGALALALLAPPGTGWLRGIGYHESIMGLPTARELDRIVPHRPLRIQHRSGRMWLLNTPALEQLLARAAPPPGLGRDSLGYTGRLFDEDAWLRGALASSPPDFAEVSAQLARCGVTGVTDMSPGNDPAMAAHFGAQLAAGALVQRCLLAGTLALAEASGAWTLGPAKLHLHESALPPFEEALAFVRAAHEQDRPAAIHCVSEVELVFALALLDEAATSPGDRIEHASVAAPGLVARIAEAGLAVCVQPHFVHERGDRYLLDVEPRHRCDLYRLASLARAGIALAGGSDAPFASADPWQAMAAAVSRQTRGGRTIGIEQALSPEQALALYTADPADLSRQRRVAPGERADLVLLDRPWAEARERLTSADVRATLIDGRLVGDGVDQPPA